MQDNDTAIYALEEAITFISEAEEHLERALSDSEKCIRICDKYNLHRYVGYNISGNMEAYLASYLKSLKEKCSKYQEELQTAMDDMEEIEEDEEVIPEEDE